MWLKQVNIIDFDVTSHKIQKQNRYFDSECLNKSSKITGFSSKKL